MDNTGHIVSEPMPALHMTSFQDVMAYLHTINITREDMVTVGRQLLYEAKNIQQAKVLRRLEFLSSLQYDWDGDGAEPVSPMVIKNLRDVMSVSKDEDWEVWMISPETNGTLALQSKQKMSSISVGIQEYSYYSSTEKGEECANHVKFSPRKFLRVMRKIG